VSFEISPLCFSRAPKITLFFPPCGFLLFFGSKMPATSPGPFGLRGISDAYFRVPQIVKKAPM
jgi:hypothetical protein